MKYLKIIIICCFIVFVKGFEVGVERKFTFINDVTIHDLKATQKTFGYRISGTSKISSVWEDSESGSLIKFELNDPKFLLQKSKSNDVEYKEKKSIFDDHPKTIFYALRNRGIIEKVFLPKTKESTTLDNFMKGFVSLFQYQLSETEPSIEDDISGACTVKYIVQTDKKFMKFKTDCGNDFETRQRSETPLAVADRSGRVNVITLKSDGKLESIHSTDHHKFAVNSYPDGGFYAGSLLYLESSGEEVECSTFKGEKWSEIVKKLSDFRETNLLPIYKKSGEVKDNLVKLVKDHKKNLVNENVGKSLSALTILELLDAGREAKIEDFTRILKAKSTQEIKGQLMDLLGAIQTVESHEAFKKSFNLTDTEDFDNVERYLQALAIGSQPEEQVIRDLLEVAMKNEFENEKLQDTLVQTISSMAHKFAHKFEQDFESLVVTDVRNFLLKSINKCEEDECKLKFIRGLGNLRSPDTIEKLHKLAVNFSYKISVAAMKALSKFDRNIFSDQYRKDFKKIFLQSNKKFDSSARTIALDIYMDGELNAKEVQELVEFLASNESAYEVKQYLVQKLRFYALKCTEFNKMLNDALTHNQHVNNWNVYGGLKGLSTVLERTFSQNPSANASLVSVQEIKGGVLKRGNVDLLLRSKDEKISLFTLGLFAGGLSSFMSSTEEVDPDEDATATAGMEISVQDVQMRPLTFFSGQGELMGHVWSGTASEPTTAYRGITLLQDHKQTIPLNSGAFLDVAITGAMSIDLNGKIEISLWYKNANSKVVQSVGQSLKVKGAVRSSFGEVSLESEVMEDPQIVLSSKIDFSSKTALCMELSQPNTEFIHRSKRSVQTIGGKKSKKLFEGNMKIRHHLPGSTHVLNRKNTEMCNQILLKKE